MSQVKTSRRLVRATVAQIRMLVDYMSSNTQFAKGDYTGPLGLSELEDEWFKLKQILKEYGPDKSILQWKFTWRDLKRRAREENAKAMRTSVVTGSVVAVSKLTDLSSKILDTIGYECSISTSAKESPVEHHNYCQKDNQDDQNEETDDKEIVHECETSTREVIPTQKRILRKRLLQQRFNSYKRRIRNPLEFQNAKRKMDQALASMKTHSQKSNEEDDESDLFAKFLAKKLRRLTEERRDYIIYKINNLLYEESYS